MHLVIIHEGPMQPLRDAASRRQVEHVAMPQQMFGALLVKNGARIDA